MPIYSTPPAEPALYPAPYALYPTPTHLGPVAWCGLASGTDLGSFGFVVWSGP